MRIIIAGGGTGGHVFPAISIADEITGRNNNDKVLFVGTKRGMENDLVKKNGYEIKHISSKGFVGRGILSAFTAFFSALKGLFESLSIIVNYKPDVVLGVGGYVSGPFVLAAFLSRKPTAICEQNTVPGVTNRILGKIVDKVFASYEASIRHFPSKKVLITGNPVRNSILKSQPISDDSISINILIYGGSQGASSLNKVVPKAFSLLDNNNISITHQTGKKDFKAVQDIYESMDIEANVSEFIYDMAGAYAKADLVIGRAGAGTIAEITALGKPSILVPFPYAAHNHQLENAKILEQNGAAVLIEDKDATSEIIADALTNLLHKDKLDVMSENAKKLGKPEASKNIVDELYKLAGDK